MKKMLIILILISASVFSQDYVMPELGLYIGGVMGTIGGEFAKDMDDLGVEMGYNLAVPVIGLSYATMLEDFPISIGVGLGARTGRINYSRLDVPYDMTLDDETISYQYLDYWVTMPIPINDCMNLNFGMLFGMALSGSEKTGNDDAVKLADEALPTGVDQSIIFGLGYALDDDFVLNMVYIHGIAALENELASWKHSGLFMSLNYDIQGI